MGMEVITIEAWAVLASIVAVISPIIVVLVKSTNIWAKLDLTVTNLSKAIADLSSLIIIEPNRAVIAYPKAKQRN